MEEKLRAWASSKSIRLAYEICEELYAAMEDK